MAEPLASAQFRMDLNMGGLFQHYHDRRAAAGLAVNPSSSGSTSMQISGDSDSVLLNAYSFSEEQSPHQYDPTSTSGSSSVLSHSAVDSVAVNESYAAGRQAYQTALVTPSDQTALVQYQTALEHFQLVLAGSMAVSTGDSRRDNQQHSSLKSSALLFQALCLRAMGRLLAATNATAALALWDQALEGLEQVLGDCYRFSQRWTAAESAAEPIANLDAIMVEIVRDKASALMAIQPKTAANIGAPAYQQQSYDEAMDCITQALRFLLDVRHFEQIRHLPNSADLVYNCLTISQHSQLLIETLQLLIQQHRQTHRDRPQLDRRDNEALPDEPVWMQRVEQAFHVLQTRQYELTKPQKMTMATLQESLSHIYLQLGDLERGSQAMADACDWLLEEQATPPAQWLDRMELFGTLLEQDAIADSAIDEQPDLVDVDAAAALDLAMACYEKALLLRNQCGLLLAAQGGPNPIHELAVANSLSNVARVMQLQGNDEGSMDLFQAAQEIYARQNDYDILTSVAVVAMEHGRWDQAIAILSQCVELIEADASLPGRPTESPENLDKTYIYFTLGQAYVGRGDYVSATICLMEAIKYEGRVSEPEIFALLQRVEFLRREEHKADVDDSLDDQHDGFSSKNGSMSETGSSVIESDGDDEGTAFYDSESVSAFLPVIDGRIAHSSADNAAVGVNVILDLDISSLKSSEKEDNPNTRRALDRSYTASEAATDNDDGDEEDESPPLPVVSPDPSLVEYPKSPTSPMSATSSQRLEKNGSIDKGSSHSAPNLMKRLGSPLRSRKDQGSVGESSQRSGLVKAIANTFRISSNTDRPKIPSGREGTKVKDKGLGERGVMSLPSEEEFHSAVDVTEFSGPLDFVDVPRSKSFDSDISSITMRLEDPKASKESGQELWWGVSAEGLGRWLPTVVNTAVEAAEGFLSARSIHSQKKSTPLFDYASSEDSDDENDESAGVLSRPAVADSRTQLAVRGSRASNSRARRRPPIEGNYDSGALGLYSGHRRKVEEIDAEIERLKRIIADQEKKFGRNHVYLATSLFTLAVLHSQQGASGTPLAIECATEALRIQKECGTTDDASRSLHFLADLYLHQKHFSAALTFYSEALRLERSHYGDVSDEAARTLNCIGNLHSVQSDFFRAMECHQEALRLLQASHGEDIKHPLVSETLCQIGSVYYRERNAFTKSQSNADKYTTFIEAGMLETIGRAHEDRGSYKLASAFFEERLAFLESRDTSATENLEEIAETLNSLGMLSSRAGRLVESLDYYERSLRIQLKLGCDAVQLATIRILIGSVHYQLGDWSRALRLHRDSLAVLLDELGDEHETVAAAHYQIGLVQAAFYELDEAMSSLTTAVAMQERLLGVDHPATLRTRREIGNLFAIKVSECNAALEQFDEVLAAQRNIHGDRHPNIAETLFSIGSAYARRGDFASALHIFEETYHMRTEFLGHDVPAQATTLYEISLIHLKRKHIKRALQICDVVLTIRENSLRDNHIDIALTLAVKGRCFVEQNRLDDADKLLTDALEMAVGTVGDGHPSVAEILVAMSWLHLKRCRFDHARSSVERALEIYERFALDDDDFPLHKETKQQLERIEHDEALFV